MLVFDEIITLGDMAEIDLEAMTVRMLRDDVPARELYKATCDVFDELEYMDYQQPFFMMDRYHLRLHEDYSWVGEPWRAPHSDLTTVLANVAANVVDEPGLERQLVKLVQRLSERKLHHDQYKASYPCAVFLSIVDDKLNRGVRFEFPYAVNGVFNATVLYDKKRNRTFQIEYMADSTTSVTFDIDGSIVDEQKDPDPPPAPRRWWQQW